MKWNAWGMVQLMTSISPKQFWNILSIFQQFDIFTLKLTFGRPKLSMVSLQRWHTNYLKLVCALHSMVQIHVFLIFFINERRIGRSLRKRFLEEIFSLMLTITSLIQCLPFIDWFVLDRFYQWMRRIVRLYAIRDSKLLFSKPIRLYYHKTTIKSS